MDLRVNTQQTGLQLLRSCNKCVTIRFSGSKCLLTVNSGQVLNIFIYEKTYLRVIYSEEPQVSTLFLFPFSLRKPHFSWTNRPSTQDDKTTDSHVNINGIRQLQFNAVLLNIGPIFPQWGKLKKASWAINHISNQFILLRRCLNVCEFVIFL